MRTKTKQYKSKLKGIVFNALKEEHLEYHIGFEIGIRETLKDILRTLKICHTEQDIQMLMDTIKERLNK